MTERQVSPQTQQPDTPLVRFMRPAHTPGLEIVHYSNLTRGLRGIPEGYTWFALVQSLEGDVELMSRGMRAQAEAGSATVGEPGEPYVLRPHSPMQGELQVVRIDNVLLDALLAEFDGGRDQHVFPLVPQQTPALTHALGSLYRAIATSGNLETYERLYTFLGILAGSELEHRGPVVPKSPAVRRAEELLHARFAETLTLDEVAAAVGTQKFTLLRAFARELGVTPHTYLVHVRMARASRLIAHEVPLADVALLVGYSEQSALHRQFTRLVGVTPGEYARALC